MTPQEEQATLLGYVSALTDGMTLAQLHDLRARLVDRFPAGAPRDALTDLVDGQLALQCLGRA